MKSRCWIAIVTVVGAVTLSSCSDAAEQLTAEDIVARCAEAMGGEHGIETLRTLRFQLSAPNRPEPTMWEIERPNWVRKERIGDMVLVFDGSRAAFLQAPANEDGTPGVPNVVDQEHWHHFEMDIALYVPAFFEYAATYVDTTSVRGSAAHLLHVTLPMGGVVEYAIDAESFLPTKISLPDWGYDVFLDDYRDIAGYKYFHKVRSSADEDDTTSLENLVINVNLGQSRFAIPDSLR